MKPAAALLVLAAMATPSPALAADVARSLEDLGRRIKPGEKVQVLERSGRVTEGVITELSESSVTVFAFENRTVPAEDILRVDREGDPVRDGILIGVAAGVAAGALAGASYAHVPEEEKAATAPCPMCESIPAMMAMGAVSGAFWGWLVDHLEKGRTPLYEASLSRTSPATVTVTPVVGRGRRGLSVAVAF
jgi:hypothetical protein